MAFTMKLHTLCILFLFVSLLLMQAFSYGEEHEEIENEFAVDDINIENLTDPYTIDLKSLDLYDIKLNTKIIDGFEAKPFQFPYQAAIFTFGKSGRILFCGGSILSKKFVITAAHCIFEKPLRILVVLGNEKLMVYNKYEVRSDVKRYIIHKKFDRPELKHDICLLQLNKTLSYSKAIRPIPLPNLKDMHTNFLNKYATVSGFGKRADGGEISKQLMYIELPIMDNAQCNNWFNDREANMHTNICTSGMDGRGACQGDSGGPLVIDNKLIGLVSFGARYCSLGYPSVYTRVPCYVKWIANYTKIPIH